jgi:hypothetical protein
MMPEIKPKMNRGIFVEWQNSEIIPVERKVRNQMGAQAPISMVC